MNLDELRSVQSKERQKDSLQNLRPSFYQEVGEYIADLEDERDRVAEQADDPFSSPEVGRLTDEIETAKDVVEAVYERRMGKLVKQASLAAAGMPADDEGLTAEEVDLFDDLVDRIESNKTRVLDVLEGADPAAVDAEPNATEAGAADREGETDPEAKTGADPAKADSGAVETETATGVESESGHQPPSETPRPSADETPTPPPQEPPDPEAEPQTTSSDGSEESSSITPADVMGGSQPASPDDDQPSGVKSDFEADPRPENDPSTDGSSGTEPAGTPSRDSKPESGRAGGPDSDDRTTGDSSANAADDVDRVTVKITRDVGSILGVDDREYTLSSDDVVTLPERNATPLVEQEAAEPLE
ncbi:hypothetical protein [Natrarchaeobius chitinivorans]|uniref:Gins51 C-terminal domain-containing protein n=1 Tax=Natrarchaeobius chitinivorans TaxID=1679083 RepID=A0A3N6NB61_NATCH|nr:hypothetical protein [Natrarchaeobius chitinivorans]RQG95852.1 hypothetical protein EA473_06590 [Natrarchaeobius chitinivorans]